MTDTAAIRDFDEQHCSLIGGNVDAYLSRCQAINTPRDDNATDDRKLAGLRFATGDCVFEIPSLTARDLRRFASFLNEYAQRLKEFPE